MVRARLVYIVIFIVVVAAALLIQPCEAEASTRRVKISPKMRVLAQQAHDKWDGLLKSQITHDPESPTGFRVVHERTWPLNEAFAVMFCESKGNHLARNRYSSATGLFQVLRGTLDPWQNVDQAYAMWKTRGWQPWRTCPWRSYLSLA